MTTYIPTWYNNIPKELKIGRIYHTTWQSKSGMRFILKEIKDNRGLLGTRHSNKTYWTNLCDLRETNKIHLNQ